MNPKNKAVKADMDADENDAAAIHANESVRASTISLASVTIDGNSTTDTPATAASPASLATASTTASATTPAINLEEMRDEQRQRQMEIRREAPAWSSRQRQIRCNTCDDCFKNLPCLVVNLDTNNPGAFSVASNEARVRRDTNSNLQSTLTSREEHRLAQLRRRSSVPDIEAIVAVLVEEDDDANEQGNERQKQIQTRVAQLEAGESELRAWQGGLEHQRLLLEQQSFGSGNGNISSLHATTAHNRTSQATIATAVAVQSQQRPAVVVDPSMAFAVAVSVETLEREALGAGPYRFATKSPQTGLDEKGRVALKRMQQKWRKRQDQLRARVRGSECFDVTPQWHIRYLWSYAKHASPDGDYYYPTDKVWKAEKKLKKRFVTLTVASLGPQLYSKTLFPVPGLKTKDGHDMFYMRPSRYYPNSTPAKTIIDNLCYVMNNMLENNEFAQKQGIGFIACMDGWTMKNFDVNYCYQFMMALQGLMVPVKIKLFLIVNPPSWFGAVWKIMKPMLALSFRKRVKICPEEKISKYLAEGFEYFLPDDMRSGKAKTDAMVVDYLGYRQYAEQGQVVHNINITRHDSGGGGSDGDIGSIESFGSMRESSSGYASFNGSSEGNLADDDDDDDDASILCDIDDEAAFEGEDIKVSSRP